MKNLTLSLSLSLSLLKNKIKQKKEKAVILLLAVLISVLFVSTITYGATTIGSNIDTGGNFTVSGNATLGDDSTDLIKSIGSFYASSTLQATGAARFYSTARIDGATILNSVSYTWPSSDGSFSQYLQTNGAGTLSWATVSGGSTSDWLKQTNFGVLNLTASTTIPYWAKDAIYASSTLQVQGLTTLGNASTTQTSVSSNFYTGLTANSIPFIGTNGLLTQNTSNLIWDNTNTRLGIGTTTPNWLLQAAGTRPFLTLSDTGAGTDQKHWFLSSQGGNFYVGTSSDALNATSTYLTITNGGNVGIGTTSPVSKLSVVGESAFAGGASVGIGYAGTAAPTGGMIIQGNVGIGTTEPLAKLHTSSPTPIVVTPTLGSASNASAVFTNSANTYGLNLMPSGSGDVHLQVQRFDGNTSTFNLNLQPQGGNVGIGTTSPYAKLSVVGETVSTYFTATSTTATSTFLGAVGVGTTTPTEQLSVSGRLFVGGTGTSTIQNNLYVMGTLRSTVSYVGDLVFSNNFKFIETPLNAKVQSLFLQNQYGENLFKIDENGKVVMKEITAKQGNFEEKLKTKELQIGSPQNRTGITIYDKKTGKPYCLEINDGKVSNKEGECK